MFTDLHGCCLQQQMSLRDKGNEHFRVGQYEQAIHCYERYIQQDPSAERPMAYCNISFSYYKMGRFRESLQAADDAIAENQQFAKAYYRKMQGYKELQGCDYEVYINAVLLLKYNKAADQKTKFDTLNTAKEYKSKWMRNLSSDKYKVEQDSCLLDMLDGSDSRNQSEDKKKQAGKRSVEEWLNSWSAKDVSTDQKWREIEEIALEEDREYGINIGYLFLNNLQQPQRGVVADKIRKLAAVVSNKMQIQSMQNQEIVNEEKPSLKQQKKSSSEDQNLFQSSQISPQIKTQTKSIPQRQPIHSQITRTNEPQQISTSTTITSITKPPLSNIEQVPPSIIKEQIKQQQFDKPQPSQNLTPQQIKLIYSQYTLKLTNSHDIMLEVMAAAEQMLKSKHSKATKKSLLLLVKQGYPKQMRLMRKGFTKQQQLPMLNLLINNDLECCIPDFAWRHVPLKQQ